MQDLSSSQRWVLAVSSTVLGFTGLLWIGSTWFADPVVRAIYAGDVLPYFGRLLRIHAANNPAHEGVGYYIDLMQGASQRVFVLAVVFYGIVVTATWKRPSLIRDYFAEEGSALSLAVFRGVVFWHLFAAIDVGVIVGQAQQMDTLRVAPPLVEWFFLHVSLDAEWVWWAARVMQAACILALIGLFSRSAAWMAGLLGIYVLGIPELGGKINHGNHLLVWFALLLGASRSGDALSVDVFVRAWRNSEPSASLRPAPSATYGRPLRWAWLLIGLIYFFPGLWKFVLGGWDWMFTESLKFKMYAKWQQIQYLPALRIDRIPALYQGLAVGTVIFELFFIVALFFQRFRRYAVFGGLAFHGGIAYFMRIFFSNLMACYVVFVPWGKIMRRLGDWLYLTPLVVRYNGNHGTLGRLAAVLRTGDWFHGIRLRREQNDFKGDVLLQAGVGRRAVTGWKALGRTLMRVPLLWPLAPIVALVFGVARMQRVAEAHSSSVSIDTSRRMVHVTGGILFGINAVFGLFLINSWPFSVYPTHAGVSGPYITDVSMMAITQRGDTLDAEPLLEMNPVRRRGLARHILSAPDSMARGKVVQKITQAIKTETAARQTREMLFYKLKISKIPEQWSKNPIERTLLFTTSVQSAQ